MSGWFAMKHGVSRHPLLRGNPARIAIWVWLVDNAVWKDTPHDIAGKSVTVKRGQVAVSQRRLADETGVGRQAVRTFLGRLQSERMVNPDVTHGKTVLTLCNYEKYQSALKDDNPPPNPAVTHDQPIKEQDNNIPVGAVDKSTPFDLKKIIFGQGISLLVDGGKSETQARPIIGKWISLHGEEAVAAAIGRAQRDGAIDPVSYIQGCFRFQAKKAEPQQGDTRTRPDGTKQEFVDNVTGWVRVYG